MGSLSDGFGRRFHYLRLSVTEVCNFRCTYCLPDGYRKAGPQDFLSVDEAGRLVSAFADLGLKKVRLTGGEPSARKDLDAIIARVAAVPGVEKLALTTNGWNLADKAEAWRAAGLSHLNVSVDSLDPGTFERLTGHARLDQVLAGVDRALDLGFQAVKLNAVLMRDTAEGFAAFADFVRERPVAVRFIELMRTGDNAELFRAQHLSGLVLKDWLTANGWRPRERGFDDGPAIEYEHPRHAGRLGLIAPYAPGFCDSCNRLRVTARGKLRLCLFGDGGIELRDLLQSDTVRPALLARIIDSLGAKAAGHRLHENDPGATRHLAQVGG
ncbi:MAG: GTP 3',8-cyclase MoaA [Proteobacteria bacterium]|nr:GTP 3',8-cyclase MoaA [Pseudomonadota bacterium]